MSSFKGYRSHDLPVDDSVLRNLENLSRKDIEDVLRVSMMAPSARTRLLNRLHNRQHRNKGRMIPAWYLTSMGFESMAEIELEDSMAHGQITNAVEVNYKYQTDRDVAITIYDPRVREEHTFVVALDDEVRVWKKPDARTSEKKDYDEVVDHGYVNVDYIASQPDSFFGKMMSIKFKGGGRLTSMGVRSGEPDIYYFTFDNGQRLRLGAKEVVHVHKEERPTQTTNLEREINRLSDRFDASRRTSPEKVVDPVPDYWGDSWWYFNNASCAGKTVQLDRVGRAKSGVKGTCTQVTYENGKLIFVIDGFMYKRNRHTVIKVWDKKEN